MERRGFFGRIAAIAFGGSVGARESGRSIPEKEIGYDLMMSSEGDIPLTITCQNVTEFSYREANGRLVEGVLRMGGKA